MNGQTHIPILGQEAVTSSYGLGRVMAVDREWKSVSVQPYCKDYAMTFDGRNVTLVPIPGVSNEEYPK